MSAEIEVPLSFQPSEDPTFLSAESRLYDFPAANASFSPSEVSQIFIPQHQSRYILGGTTYLNFRVKVDTGYTLAISTGGTQPQYSIASYFLGGPTKSAAALVDRIWVSAPNGQVLADISNYAAWHNLMLIHGASEDYSRNAAVSEQAFAPVAIDSTLVNSAALNQTLTSTLDIQLPLFVGLFNQKKAFPLWALNGPMIVSIQWAAAGKAVGICAMPLVSTVNLATSIATQPATTISSTVITGTNLSLRNRCVDVDIEYINHQKSKMMKGGHVLKYKCVQPQNLVVRANDAGGYSFNFGINVSSLLAVFGINLVDNDFKQVASTNEKELGSATTVTGSGGFSQNSNTNIRVFRDGTQLTSFPLCNSGYDDAFPPLMEAIGATIIGRTTTIAKRTVVGAAARRFVANAIDNYRASQCPASSTICPSVFSLPISWASGTFGGGSVYSPCGWAWGVSARTCQDHGGKVGHKCSQLAVQCDTGLITSTNTLIFFTYESTVVFDHTGNCLVKR